jgi:Amt family ammonium transporter
MTDLAIVAQVARVDTGDTAWMLAATALVLMMTPALGLFYAGLVRSKNTLNTIMMSIAAIAVATVTWALVGYSLAFD